MKQELSKKANKLQPNWAICKSCGLEKPEEEFAFRSKQEGTRRRVCRSCVSIRQNAVKQNDMETVKWFSTTNKVDYTNNKPCKECGIIKTPNEFPKNGERRKNICRSCVSVKAAERNKNKVYDDIGEDFNCRTCDVLVKVEDVYIENKRNNKPCTQCRDCYFAEVNHRKNKRRIKIKDSSQMNTPEEEARIKEIYRQCKKITKLTGVGHEVDHIKPLSKGGAHHPDNLQIITAEENRRKADKYETKTN